MTLAEFLCHGVFRTLALGFGTFFGIYGFFMALAAQLEAADGGPWQERASWASKVFAVVALFFQFWFNFVGGFAGWVAVAFLWNEPFKQYSWREVATVIVAFLGITGNLPHLSTGIREAVVAVGKRLGG